MTKLPAVFCRIGSLERQDKKTKQITKTLEPLRKKFPDKFGMIFHVDFNDYLDDTKLPVLKYDQVMKCYTDIVLARLYLHDIFPDLDRVIHLDDDIQVVKSLSNLWEFRPNAPLVATEHPSVPYQSKSLYEKYKVNHYFCAGVMVMNLNYIRTNNIFDKFVQLRNDIKIISLMDETLLNIVYKDIVVLPEDNRFGFYPPFVETKVGLNKFTDSRYGKKFGNLKICNKADVVIVHWFNGWTRKPWVSVYNPYFSLRGRFVKLIRLREK